MTQDISCYARTLMQLCVWREARGVPEAWAAVSWVIMNRANRMADARAISVDEAIQRVVTAPGQFDGMILRGDPNTVKWPLPDAVWSIIANVVDDLLDGVTPDNTNGATFYFSPPLTSPPTEWGQVVKTGQFGSIQTYKESV